MYERREKAATRTSLHPQKPRVRYGDTANQAKSYLASQARELGDVGVAEVLLRVEALLGEAPYPHRQGGDLLLEGRLPAEVPISVCFHQPPCEEAGGRGTTYARPCVGLNKRGGDCTCCRASLAPPARRTMALPA